MKGFLLVLIEIRIEPLLGHPSRAPPNSSGHSARDHLALAAFSLLSAAAKEYHELMPKITAEREREGAREGGSGVSKQRPNFQIEHH